MNLLTIPRVILAGGAAKPDIQAASGQQNRAQIEVMGKTMLQHVVDALLDADTSAPIAVMGNLPLSDQYSVLEDQGGFVENLFGGFKLNCPTGVLASGRGATRTGIVGGRTPSRCRD